MQCSYVNKSELNEEFRIDSEYYSPENLRKKTAVTNHKYELLGNLCDLIAGPFGSAVKTERYEQDSGKRYIRGKDIQSFFLEKNDAVYIEEDLFHELSQFHLRDQDIMLTVVGMKFGKVAIIDNEDLPAIFSCKSTLIRNPKINVWYLLAYLACDVGYGLIRRGQRGAAQPGINLFDIQTIPVPLFGADLELQVEGVIKKSKFILEKSSKLFGEAQDILISELDLTSWQPKHQLSFIKKYSDIEQTGRLDAEYYEPKYDEIIKAIKSYSGGWDTLGNLCLLVGHPSNPPYANMDNKDKTFIVTQKHLGDFSLSDEFWNDDEALYTTQEFIDKNKQYILKNDDVLLYSVGAYIGKANIYKESIKATIGSFLTLLRVKKEKINPYYLLSFLNTDIGIAISKQHQRGMAQQYLYPYDIKTFPIPMLSKEIQIKIQQKVTESLDLRKKSKHLLECAKRAVEMAIEQDEPIAIKWLNEQVGE